MKFSKPINREVDIEGITFVVSFDDNGIDFRVKGKRRTAHADWTQVLNITEGEQGANGRAFLGVEAGLPQQQQWVAPERLEQIFDPQAADTSQPQATAAQATAAQATGAQAQASETNQSQEAQSTGTTKDELGRAVSAGETGPES